MFRELDEMLDDFGAPNDAAFRADLRDDPKHLAIGEILELFQSHSGLPLLGMEKCLNVFRRLNLLENLEILPANVGETHYKSHFDAENVSLLSK